MIQERALPKGSALFEREIEKLRKLMWFTVGFAAACAVGAYLLFDNILLLIAGIALLFGIVGCFLKNLGVRITATILLGIAAGGLWVWGHHAIYLNTAKYHDGKTVETTVEIIDYSYPTEFGIAADGKIKLEGKSYRIRLYTTGAGPLSPGDTVTGSLELRYTGAGGKQNATYHQGSGIPLLGYADKASVVQKATTVPRKYFAAELRQTILNQIENVFPQDTTGFARALLLGETDQLSYRLDVAFQRSGIRHVVAVSGLHIAILFSLVYLLTMRRRLLTVLLGIPVLVLFAMIAGFTPSVVRACVMQGLIVLALLVDKEYDPPTALATAVLVMLVANPMTITSVSFQLSVGCMVGIFLFSGKIHKFLYRGKVKKWGKGKGIPARCVRWTVNSVCISVSATVLTVPLSAFYFGSISIVSVVTNILTLWIISFIFYGIMIACALGFLWPVVGKAVAWFVSWFMRYVIVVADWMSAIPFAAVYTCSVYILAWLIFVYVLIAVFLFCKKKRPKEFLCCIAVSLAFCIGCSYVEPLMGDYRMTVLDVGHGQCILLQSKGKTYMVDCGGTNADRTADAAVHALYAQGVTTLDGFFMTHYDRDHVSGVENLLSQIHVKKLYLPDIATATAYREVFSKADAPITWVTNDTVIEENNVRITLCAGGKSLDENENSMCVLFQTEKCDILITGDRSTAGEAGLLSRMSLPQLEILVAGHHGSKNSTGTRLLEATMPKVVVISGDAPSGELLERIAMYGISVLRTDLQGTFTLRG